jgi:hypothetical protein
MNREQNIEELMDEPEESLLALLGAELTGANARQSSRPGRIEIARRWMNVQTDELQRIVCSSAAVREMSDGTAGRRRLLLIAAVADALLAAHFSVAPVTVAILIVNEGIDSFCASPSSNTSHTSTS